MTLKHFCALLGVLALSACGPSSTPISDNLFSVGPGLVLAGTLNPGALEELAKDNAIVIDLRTAKEGTDIEAHAMEQAGIPYFNIPMDRGALPQSTVRQFSQVLDEYSDRQIVVHCASGNRAGLLWAARLKEQGQSTEAVQAAVAGIVTKDPVLKAIADYVPASQQ